MDIKILARQKAPKNETKLYEYTKDIIEHVLKQIFLVDSGCYQWYIGH